MKKYKKIYIEITNKCNLNCSFCSKNTRKKRNMTEEEFEQILKKIKDYTDYIYLHVTGEPLLHPNIIQFINKAKEYNLKVNLTTNGTLLEKYAKELGTCENLNKINISLHSENNIPNYCEKIFSSIKKLSAKTTVIFRLWTLNNNQLDEKSTKIVERMINYYHLPQDSVEKISTTKNYKISSTIYVDKDNKFEWPKVSNYKSKGYCHGLKSHIAILSDGTVVPCCLDASGVVNLGNIFQNDIKDILESERTQKLKQSFQDRKPTEPLCQSCTFKERL